MIKGNNIIINNIDEGMKYLKIEGLEDKYNTIYEGQINLVNLVNYLNIHKNSDNRYWRKH